MNLISGVLKEDYSDYVLYFVESLSDELKQEMPIWALYLQIRRLLQIQINSVGS